MRQCCTTPEWRMIHHPLGGGVLGRPAQSDPGPAQPDNTITYKGFQQTVVNQKLYLLLLKRKPYSILKSIWTFPAGGSGGGGRSGGTLLPNPLMLALLCLSIISRPNIFRIHWSVAGKLKAVTGTAGPGGPRPSDRTNR